MKFLRMFVVLKLCLAGGAIYLAMWLFPLDFNLTLLFMGLLGLTFCIGWVIFYQASRSIPFTPTQGKMIMMTFAFLGMLNIIVGVFIAHQLSQALASFLGLGFFAMLMGLANPNKSWQIAEQKSSSISA